VRRIIDRIISLENSIDSRYYVIMGIKSFNCKQTEKIWEGKFSKKLPQDIQGVVKRKLNMLAVSSVLDDLNTPPSNHLEKYCGNKKLDKYSIRVNDQWRLCFYFRDGDAYEVEIVDYH
jgi:proteic killer suppression protein